MSKISFKNPKLKWLFGGLGFHNSEATMTALMSEKVKNEIILKTFREISPTFSRVFAVYADWSKEAMDAFADYYDETYRKAGTLVYAVPGRMPYITDEDDIDVYCEKVAEKLDYLINVRNCTKIRYYCLTNELSVGNTYCWFKNNMELFKKYNEGLFKAFRRHNLDVGIVASDAANEEHFYLNDWVAENMDEITSVYCNHLYSVDTALPPGDLKAYDRYVSGLAPLVKTAHSKEKRFMLGEFGVRTIPNTTLMPMMNDSNFSADHLALQGDFALAFAELAMAAINTGCLATAYWTMFDYPAPLIRENGDTPYEKARYDAVRFSGHGLEIRYNKNGLIRWDDENKDYSSYASLYTLGLMAKFFKKGSRVLETQWDSEFIRACGVIDEEKKVTLAMLNWSESEEKVQLSLDFALNKKARLYAFEADNIPFNDFNDLQPYSAVLELSDENEITLPPKSLILLTTDYEDRTPSKVKGVKVKNGRLCWKECKDSEHVYYRVFKDGAQIASTVALSLPLADKVGKFTVKSVDKWGNQGE